MVKYTEFDVTKVVAKKCETKPLPIKSGGNYSFFYLSYNFGTDETPRLGRLTIEGPKCYSRNGISKNEDEEKGITRYSIQAKFVDPVEAEKFYELTVALEQRVAKLMYDFASEGQLQHVQIYPDESEAENRKMIYRTMKRIMYIQKDERGRRIEGSVPSMFINLNSGFPKESFKSRFATVIGKDPITEKIISTELEWELLEDMKVTYTPLISYYRLYSGSSNKSIQSQLVSATVENLEEPEIYNPQEETCAELASMPGALEQIAAGIKLAEERQKMREAGRSLSKEYEDDEKKEDERSFDPIEASKLVASLPGISTESTSSTVKPVDPVDTVTSPESTSSTVKPVDPEMLEF